MTERQTTHRMRQPRWLSRLADGWIMLATGRHRALVVAGLLTVLVIVHHGRSLGGFLALDDLAIHEHARHHTWWDHLLRVTLLQPAFRPMGVLIYSTLGRLFGLHAAAYHAVTGALHVLNGVQLYGIALTLTASPLAALTAALVFVYQHATSGVFWFFPTIFDVLATAFYWRALAWYLQTRQWRTRNWRHAASVLSFLGAVGCKEHALTLPLVLTGYELFWHPPASWTRARLRAWCATLLGRQWYYYAIMGLFFYEQVLLGAGTDPTGGHAFVFTAGAWLQGMDWYLRDWFREIWPWPVGLGIGVAAVGIALALRDRVLLFACYSVIVMSPLVLMVGRTGTYWYLPQLGMALYAGRLAQRLRQAACSVPILRRDPLWAWGVTLALLAAPLHLALPHEAARRQKRVTEDHWIARGAACRDFVASLQAQCAGLSTQNGVIVCRVPTMVAEMVYDDLGLTTLLRAVCHDKHMTGRIDALSSIASRSDLTASFCRSTP